MNELWVPGIPAHPLPYLGQLFEPSAFLGHRTIGRWAGDYSVLSRGRVPSVHGLCGHDEGQAVQWYPANRTVAGAAGANGYAFQWEFSGQNGENFTPWQQHILDVLMAFARRNGLDVAHRLREGDGRVPWWAGYLNHSNVRTEPRYTHFDFINDPFVDAALAAAGGPAPVNLEDDMIAQVIDGAGLLHEFGIGTDDRVYHNIQGPDGKWWGWGPLGGPGTRGKNPDAVYNPDTDRITVTVQGDNLGSYSNSIKASQIPTGTGWSGWVNKSGKIKNAIPA